MIFGTVTIDGHAVHTQKDTYRIADLSVFSVRRPFLAVGATVAAGTAAFGFVHADLLYLSECLAIGSVSVVSLIGGLMIGQLQFLSRDLRGSELAGAIYGTYGHLNRVRKEVFSVQRSLQTGGRP
ncbi:hypothetical protein [Jiella pacifica]|uniref:Uncharacterized protein n=1 Tax=Jiella pacifica TaxID=2696469 RepID=A0A6N9T7F8_9HYPH|nr:hypothetical protein [Jiella pacifica]NDW06482.1 hypothetical protein [Jiella pacifica]